MSKNMVPGTGLDQLMAEFSQISTIMVRGRKQALEKSDAQEEEELKASEQPYPKTKPIKQDLVEDADKKRIDPRGNREPMTQE